MFSFLEIMCEGACFLHATLFEDIRGFRMCQVTCRNFTLPAEKVSPAMLLLQFS